MSDTRLYNEIEELCNYNDEEIQKTLNNLQDIFNNKTNNELSYNEIMVQKIDKLIIDEWEEYSPSELNDLIVLLIQNHEFYTKEQINNLIEDLEKLKDLY